MERPTEMHISAIKRILRYLKGSVNFAVMYKRNEMVSVIGLSDSYYARYTNDRKSISGFV
jgi:hypothetical protein